MDSLWPSWVLPGSRNVTCAPWSWAATSKAHRVRVEVFSKMRAMFLPVRRGTSVPVYLAVFSSAASRSRKRHSAVLKSSSLRKLRLRRLNDMIRLLDGVAFDRAGHAAGATTAAAQLAAGDGDDLDALLAQVRVGGDVALVADDHAGLDREEVVAVVPLLALGGPLVLVGDQHAVVLQPDGLGDGREHVVVLL